MCSANQTPSIVDMNLVDMQAAAALRPGGELAWTQYMGESVCVWGGGIDGGKDKGVGGRAPCEPRHTCRRAEGGAKRA